MAIPAWAGNIHPGLQDVLDAADPNETVSTLVYLNHQVDLDLMTAQLKAERASRQARHELAVTALHETATSTRGNLRDHLAKLQTEGRIQRFRSFWIVNAFAVDATKAEIVELANHPDVDTIYFNYPIELIKPVPTGDAEVEPEEPQPCGPRTPEPGLVAVRAPEAWALGYTGEGILVATLDTGVDGTHPALASRWRGLDERYAFNPEWAFFDPVTSWTFPHDGDTHGTHTMGTICGGAPGDEVGVAPGAEWIQAAVIDRVGLWETIEDAIEAFQWLIDPDGNPATVWDVPWVCSNSWGIVLGHNVPPYNEPCNDGFWSYLDACETAGCVILFSAGNSGPGSNTVGRPGDRASDDYRTCAVAAVDAHDAEFPIAYFSSRGPTYCTPDGSIAIKPDIAAPGMNVRSSVPGGGYGNMNGTSMASPHVAGVVALILQVCPQLFPDDVKQILYDSALDLGPAGKDNTYGYGMIDAYQAVLLAELACSPAPPYTYDGSFETAVDTPLEIALVAVDRDGEPGGSLSYIIQSLPTQDLIDPGNSHVIQATELPYTLSDHGNVVVYSPAGGYYGVEDFQFTADDGGTPPEGGESDLGTVTVLTFYGPPVIVTESFPNGCLNAPYTPFWIEVSEGQPQLTFSVATDAYAENDLGTSLFAEVGIARGWHMDDANWAYTLPFEFQFFDQPYSTVYVHTNGFLDFASGMGSDRTNTTAELLSNVRIATLWDDWETECGGGDDIYIDDSVAGQVTFRWQAEQYPCDEEGDFSCTLTQAGAIYFHYGPTNTGMTPTVGISAGDGERYLLCQYDGATSLTNANSLELRPIPLPDGMHLTTDGCLTGTPTSSGLYETFFRVVDSFGRADTKQITLLIEEECPYTPGDLNCDGNVNNFDIGPFVLAITDPAGYAEQYPDCNHLAGDVNGDGEVNNFDIGPFVALITGG
jgi:subtilisin family serine protease